ncbi:hypothetical protein PV325_012628 [Microctonus aethiopoides]|nr:hypothetical protein PV325_012628 [Microctonus aethiopoides]
MEEVLVADIQLAGIPRKCTASNSLDENTSLDQQSKAPTLKLVQPMTNRWRLSRYTTIPPEMLGNKNSANEQKLPAIVLRSWIGRGKYIKEDLRSDWEQFERSSEYLGQSITSNKLSQNSS